MLFETVVTHSFIAVFSEAQGNGPNGWSQEQVNQGFSWRPGSVSFSTGADSGLLKIEIEKVSSVILQAKSMRAIRLPFLSTTDKIEIFDVVSSFEYLLGKGNYALTFQHGWQESEEFPGDFDQWCLMSFVAQEGTNPEILRADDQIKVPDQFDMTARAA